MYGTNTVLDQLALIRNQTVIEYGEDRLAEQFQQFFDAQNRLVGMMLDNLVEPTTERISTWGSAARIDMIRIDEYTRADAQKAAPSPADIGWPLEEFQVSLQWTRKALQVMTVADAAKNIAAVGEADLRNLRKEIARAIFTPTNNLTYKDRMVDNYTIPLRALLNADSAPIPDDEFGNTFNAATHTHYLGTGSLVAADVEGLLNTVAEHGVGGQLFLFINRAQEAAVSAMANFDPFLPVRIEPGGGSTADVAQGARLAPFDWYNRAIGLWNGNVEVWVKPWVYANYMVALDTDPDERPLRMRFRDGIGRDLRVVAEDERYPLRAQTYEREFGLSVWGRSNAAVLRTNNATYAAPTIT